MKTRLLVVDDNENIVNLVKKYFQGSTKIEVVKEAYDGEQAVKIIEEEKDTFDILLLDLIMPRKDGIYVLEYMKENKIDKKVIVMTSYNEEEMIREVSEYGVRYYALKPFDFNDLEKKILYMTEFKKQNDKLIDFGTKDIQITITKLLHALGIPSHIKGYQFIRSAIAMVYDNPRLIGGITKELYPDLSIKFNTSIQRVERAIRHAIEISWIRGDIELMEDIFGHSVDIDKSKPTNSEFIVTIADKLRLEMIQVK
jgi:two-component system response regulator (stage 0 sporulation protein A)